MLVFVCLSRWLGVMPAAGNNEFEILRSRHVDFITGGSTYNTDDNNISAKIIQINNSAQSNWDQMDKAPNRTYLWSYLASTADSSHIVESYNKLLTMATAYRTRGAALCGNEALKSDILGALDWLYENRFSENVTLYDNWWSWEIGAPMALVDICILMYDDFASPADLERILRPVQKYGGDPANYYYPGAPNATSGATTAANRTWKCINLAKYGILMQDGDAIALALNSMDDAFQYVTRTDGFYADGSFIQHYAAPSVGVYGINHFTDTTTMIYLLSGSQWAFTAGRINRICEWAFNTFEPHIYRGSLLAAPAESLRRTANRAICALLLLCDLTEGSVRERLKSMAKTMISEYAFSKFFSECASISGGDRANRLLADEGVLPRADYLIYKQYPNMDRVVKQGEGYAFTVSMHSTRIFNYESVNGGNLKGWHTGDGMTALYNADDNQYYENYWSTVDCHRLPGTTVNQRYEMPQRKFGRSAWAGGTDMDNTYGVTGMVLAPGGLTLSANKSWFIFDNEIVALGSGITSNDGYVVETVVENRRLNAGGSNAFYVNGAQKPASLSWNETLSLNEGDWAHLEGNVPGADIGYYFPEVVSLTALRENCTGRWSDYKAGGSTAENTNSFLTLWIDYGEDAQSSNRYAYTILPGMSALETSAYAENPDIEIIENSAAAHAVYEKHLKILGAAFWQSQGSAIEAFGSGEYIKSDGQAAVMVKNTDNEISISVSDPTHRQSGSLLIELCEAADGVTTKDDAVTVISLYPKIILSVAVGGKHGQTFKASFYREAVGEYGDIRFEAEGGEGLNTLPEFGRVYAVCAVGRGDADPMLIFARYDADKRLRGISTADEPRKEGEAFELRAQLIVDDGKSGCAKAFLWDKSTMAPIKNAAVLPAHP